MNCTSCMNHMLQVFIRSRPKCALSEMPALEASPTPATSLTCAGELQESVFMVAHPQCRLFASEFTAFCTSLLVFAWCKRGTPTSGDYVNITTTAFWQFFSKDDGSGSNSACPARSQEEGASVTQVVCGVGMQRSQIGLKLTNKTPSNYRSGCYSCRYRDHTRFLTLSLFAVMEVINNTAVIFLHIIVKLLIWYHLHFFFCLLVK